MYIPLYTFNAPDLCIHNGQAKAKRRWAMNYGHICIKSYSAFYRSPTTVCHNMRIIQYCSRCVCGWCRCLCFIWGPGGLWRRCSTYDGAVKCLSHSSVENSLNVTACMGSNSSQSHLRPISSHDIFANYKYATKFKSCEHCWQLDGRRWKKMLAIPIVGPWLAWPVLAFGFSLLLLSVIPGFTGLAPVANAIIIVGLFWWGDPQELWD